MKTILILPAVVLGAASLVLSTSVVAETQHYNHQPVNPITGLAHATGTVVSGVGHVAVGVVSGVAHGTAYIFNGVAHTTKKIVSGNKTTTVHHQVKHVNY